METLRDRIATEGLRLVLKCKVPRFDSSGAGSNRTLEQQKEWSKRLLSTLPPLLDWIEQHRELLFEDWGSSGAAVQEFQKRFLLVFLEQMGGLLPYNLVDNIVDRLFKLSKDVERILTTNAAIRSWLFHYYGGELGLQGWQCRPGDLYGFSELFSFLDSRDHELDVLFGQKMLSFMEHIGKELLGFQQNLEFQKIGIRVMDSVMKINFDRRNCTNDAPKILQMGLQLNMRPVEEDEYDLWEIIYFAVSSICNAKNAKSPLDDEVMLYLLAYLNRELKKKGNDRTVSFNSGQLAYLRAVTLLLLLDVPDLDLKNGDFDGLHLTISGVRCDRDAFRRHVKSHLRSTANLRFSLSIRLRIAKMIPKLFVGFTSIFYVDDHAYDCLELLAWMTMFPVGRTTGQQKWTRGFMLHRLLEEMKLMTERFLKDPTEYTYTNDDFRYLNTNLRYLLTVVGEGLKLLPNAGFYRGYKSNMQTRMTAVLAMADQVQDLIDEDL